MRKSGRKPGSSGRRKISRSPSRKPSSPRKLKRRPSRPTSKPSSSRSSTKRTARRTPSRRPAAGAGPKPKRVSKRRPTARQPESRAAARKGAIPSRRRPKPTSRRLAASGTAAGIGSQRGELGLQVEQLQARFSSLAAEAQLSDIYTAIGDFDAELVELPITLNRLRDRGYVHSGQLDAQLAALDATWSETKPRVEAALRSHVGRLQSELNQAERLVNTVQLNRSSLSAAQSSMGSLQGQIRAANDAVQGLYEGIWHELSRASHKIGVVGRMMDLLDESQEIRLLEAEGPLLAVDAEWHRDGDEGPEGALFLTDQRLIFEQREEVVTKKVLGLFKADSEERLKVLFDIKVADVESLTNKEEGGFLGMGKADILEIIFTAAAPISRARLHLKGQDSADWAAMMKRVQTGEINEHRADAFVEELQEAEALAAAFPTQCPNCFADVPVPPRGTESVTCEYCGKVITPQVEA